MQERMPLKQPSGTVQVDIRRWSPPSQGIRSLTLATETSQNHTSVSYAKVSSREGVLFVGGDQEVWVLIDVLGGPAVLFDGLDEHLD